MHAKLVAFLALAKSLLQQAKLCLDFVSLKEAARAKTLCEKLCRLQGPFKAEGQDFGDQAQWVRYVLYTGDLTKTLAPGFVNQENCEYASESLPTIVSGRCSATHFTSYHMRVFAGYVRTYHNTVADDCTRLDLDECASTHNLEFVAPP